MTLKKLWTTKVELTLFILKNIFLKVSQGKTRTFNSKVEH